MKRVIVFRGYDMRLAGIGIVLCLTLGVGLGFGRLAGGGNAEGSKSVSSLYQKSDWTFEQVVASTLNGLQGNLEMEKSRGQRDIELYQALAEGVVLIQTKQASGSGALISDQGVIVTNAHVVEGNQRVTVYFKPKGSGDNEERRAASARVRKVDVLRDLAIVVLDKAPERKLPTFQLGDITKVQVGQDVRAIGHPKGLAWSYTTGIVSNVFPHRWKAGENDAVHEAMVIQTQTPINPGNSGGPLMDDKGNLIGINTFVTRDAQALNFAVAVNEVKKILDELSQDSPAPRPEPNAPQTTGNLSCDERRNYSRDPRVHILGCYVTEPSAPPPDTWIVVSQNREWGYRAEGARDKRRVDRVGEALEQGTMQWYVDQNCDGRVDLISVQDRSGAREDYRPTQAIRLVSRAVELDQALKKGDIPFPVTICQ